MRCTPKGRRRHLLACNCSPPGGDKQTEFPATRAALVFSLMYHVHALPRLSVLTLVACCYRVPIVSCSGYGSWTSRMIAAPTGVHTSLRGSATFPGNSVTLGLCPFCPAHKPFSSSPLASQPGPNHPFYRLFELLHYLSSTSFSPKCVLCVQSAHAASVARQ